MNKYQDYVKENEEQLKLRYELMKEKVIQLTEESCGFSSYALSEYVSGVSTFLKDVYSVYETICQKKREDIPLATWEMWNDCLYADIQPEKYVSSFSNPSYCSEKFGKGQLSSFLCFLYVELRSLIPSAYEKDLFDLTIYSELFVEVVTLFEDTTLDTKELEKAVRRVIYDFEKDYSEIIVAKRLQSQVDASLDFAADIIQNCDLDKPDYLYYYGEYIGENELDTAKYLSTFSQAEIDAMAFTYTDGYREGFEIAGIDLSKKKTVNIRYNVGFERIVRSAIRQFEKLGLEPAIYRAATKSLDKKQHLKIGFTSSSPNKQYDYDHRFDSSLYMDKAFVERRLEVLSDAYENLKEQCSVYAGPACMEVFGETPFVPETKESAVTLDDEQQELFVHLQTQSNRLANQYIPHDQYSFTIIAYPLPSIGSDYEAIFNETVKVNNLDKKKYQKIQQRIIDVLDLAEYVHVVGKNGNETDMKVMLHPLHNPDKETNFENCLADVNIPVGEVFTSPLLTGTEGTLHVSSVYLNDLDFKDLKLQFKDGMVTDYHCSNFAKEQENRSFIEENLLNHRPTLPIGEFAIGTNTTAYVMARRYDIVHKLPILIVEKMGPHFAVGDTCYSHSEEVKLYNPDGKEIIAKENECSLLRGQDMDKAYFNCHTDITIPYDEIGLIEACLPDGTAVVVIEDGKFVLDGTEELNLEEMQ